MTDLLIICLFKWIQAVIDCVELQWDMLVDVAFPEEPFFIGTVFDDVLEKGVNLKVLQNIDAKAFLERSGRLMGDYVIHLVVVLLEICNTVKYLIDAGNGGLCMSIRFLEVSYRYGKKTKNEIL